jgi:hypothetical protein
MNATQLHKQLQGKKINLSELSRLSEIGLRTLRRIRNGHSVARQDTVNAIAPHLIAGVKGKQ